MSLARHDKSRDENEPQIVEALRRGGASVHRIDTPCDLLVGISNTTQLIEVKRPLGPRGGASTTKLTEAQMRFRHTWKGSDVEILRTVAEVQEWLQRKRKRVPR